MNFPNSLRIYANSPDSPCGAPARSFLTPAPLVLRLLHPHPMIPVRSRSLRAALCGFLALVSTAAAQPAPAVTEADVVIYGGTAAGAVAAIQAARMGRSVVLLEPGRYLGGMTTGGLGATDTGAPVTVGGIAREFYGRIYNYYQQPEVWRHETRAEYGPKHELAISERLKLHWFFEPHVATQHLQQMLQEAGVRVLLESPLDRAVGGVTKEGGQIRAIRTVDGRTFTGRVFIDTTYEGDLMAAAGASYIVGREPNSRYNEKLNGIVYLPARRTAHVSPFVVPGKPESGLLPRILPAAPGPEGEGDGRTQAYNFRVCLTDVPENQVPFTQPEGYDPINYELVLRHVLGSKPGMLPGNKNNSGLFTLTPMPNRKTDSNNRNLFSTDYVGRSWDWAEASYAQREEIRLEHENYIRGLFWFLATDPRVPQALQTEVRRWGLAKDEFKDNHNWPTQLYVREARRLIGEFVITEHVCRNQVPVEDVVAMGSYALDSHLVSLFVDENQQLRIEGAFFESVRPYPISYRALLPKRQEVSNLLVPVCLSASHAAYGSARMEPVFMMLAQSAATAAALSLEQRVALHDLPYATLRARLEADGQVLYDKNAKKADEAKPATAPAAAAATTTTTPPAPPAPVKVAPKPAAPSVPNDPKLAALLVKLEKAGIIQEKAYWYINARPKAQCDGERVGAAIIAAAARYEPAADLESALAILMKRRVITRTDYWQSRAKPGRQCSGGQVASLFSRLAQDIR